MQKTNYSLSQSLARKSLRLPGLRRPDLTAEQILRDLTAIPSVTGNFATNHKAIQYIHRFLRSQGMHTNVVKWNGAESLIATTRPTKTPTVFFMGHIDVVTAQPYQFTLKKKNDKYIGRGVLDMKGGIAAYLSTVQSLRKHLASYDFGVMIVTDEESGGYNGCAKLVEAGYIPKAMVVMDGAGDWNIEQIAKGMWHLTIEAVGKSAHGSRPWEGDNAIDKIIAAIQDIKKLFPAQHADSSTISVGIINGGHTVNQIPAKAATSIDIRFASREDQKRLTRKITKLVTKHGVHITESATGDVMTNDPQAPFIAAYADCAEQVLGRSIEWIMSKATNDSRWFAENNVQCIVSYPRGGGHHGDEEWIGIETLDQMQRIFMSYLSRVAKSPDSGQSSTDQRD